jgi:hypothetical protein
MCGVGVSPCGIGILQWLVPALVARGTGRWKESDHLVPSWAQVTDAGAVKAFYRGQANWLTYFPSWFPLILLWSMFLITLFFAMYCLSTL